MQGSKHELDGRRGVLDFMYAATTQDPLWHYSKSSSFGCRTAETLFSQEALAAAAEAARHLRLVLASDAFPFQIMLTEAEGAYILRGLTTSLSIFTISCGMQRYGCVNN